MASSSSSSLSPRNINKYDVFLSFRGEDTRDNFTSHLYSALSLKSIQTFIDDQLNRGDEISQSLVYAIENSAISLIIFSEGYASSRWCLDELVKILQCKREYAQIVIPVFYRVDPSDVRNQTGPFGDSFSKLEERFKENSEKLKSWRNALKEAASFSGFDSQNFRLESELIKKAVHHILKRLAEMSPCNYKNQLVGVESRVKEIESLLGAESKYVYTLGIWGFGGIGKTTIARAIFDKISSNFEGSCFLQNVREESQRPGGLAYLRQELFSKLLKEENVILDIDLNFRRLSSRKVLIVFDDVTCFNQVESLIRSLDWFMPESQIIITTRDKQILRNWGVKKIYEMKALMFNHALELFSRHAFRQNYPDVGYEELSRKVMEYAQGVPLALKVLGCFLFEREKEVWEDAINKLRRILHPSIQEVLKLSYDGLDDKEKNIFLDVACFLNGEDIYSVMKFLDTSGFYPEIGISVLIDKSLIVVSCNKITMHDLLQGLGREIVQQESINRGNRSRLWHHEDIYEVLTHNMVCNNEFGRLTIITNLRYRIATGKIEGICLDMSKVKEIHINSNTFTKMCRLRFLKFYSSIEGENKCKVSDFQGPGFAEVRYLHWHRYPLKSLPSNIQPEKLVLLEMPHSNIQQLWDGVQACISLYIYSCFSDNVITMIIHANIFLCLFFREQHHGKLKQIISVVCNIFTNTPKPLLIPHLDMLVILNLSGCSKLKRLPDISSAGNMQKIFLNGTAIEELPSSIECLRGLLGLYLEDCKSLKSLPNSLCNLKSLAYLNLNGCSNLQRLPESLGQLSSLVELYLEKNNLERIPESIVHLSKLKFLFLRYSQRLQSLPKLPCSLFKLDAHRCMALESLSGLFSSYESYRQNFDLSDNFKLNQNQLRGIVEDAMLEIQIMATTRWKEEEEQNRYFPSCDGLVILPGNEIPTWFRFQSMGSSITLPPDHLLLGYYSTIPLTIIHPHDWEYNIVPEAVRFGVEKATGGILILQYRQDFLKLFIPVISAVAGYLEIDLKSKPTSLVNYFG
ncbi:ADP-ribosyl cyclase/cyclic ADP-ribose hydrolase [Citrus sinensis]|uniref:ADP-ribosyl cyclase/cyclic ADP-ribose hydrolase n=1 Tax=Citrus sinensis TaxID=2711 RepID=A0ACB8M8D7_CITSI|nr:ADP-ribosyl cyclase/cyclic ADP-ribose hydrolase [Citrus sinensis]